MSKEEPSDVMGEPSSYENFYEQLGERYPETELVHADRETGSRYHTVVEELRPFAVSGARLVDIGCNDGVYTITYCKMGGQATGIDISKSLVAKARTEADELGLPCKFISGDIEDPELLKMLHEPFEVALFSEVLEHVRDPARALTSIRSLLKKGGHLVLTTPTPLFNGVKSKWRYPLTVFGGRMLVEKNVVDTRNIPVLMEHGIPESQYRHDGYYPLALKPYVEGFGFKFEKGYTMGYEGKMTRAFFFMRLWGGDPELLIRKIPLLNLLGVTNITVFSAV